MRMTLDRKKRPNEKFPIGVDFSNDLEVGDSVITKTVTALDADNANTDVTGTFISTTSLSGNVIGAVIQAGTTGHRYRVIFKATTNLSRTYEHEVLVEVNDAV